MSAFDYIMLGIASPFLLVAFLFIAFTVITLGWPILIGLFFVYICHLPMWILFIFGFLTCVYWCLLMCIKQ